MRSVKWLSLAFVLTALAGACSSPLDEPIGEDQGALVSASQASGLPGCGAIGAGALAGGALVPTALEDWYAVSVRGTLVCGATGDEVVILTDAGGPLEGTPLPARTASDDDPPLDGTPLPAYAH
jgi:hypothetical protein